VCRVRNGWACGILNVFGAVLDVLGKRQYGGWVVEMVEGGVQARGLGGDGKMELQTQAGDSVPCVRVLTVVVWLA
jgi:hypothetical protein